MKNCKNCGKRMENDEDVCKNCDTKNDCDEYLQSSESNMIKKSSLFENFRTNLRMYLSEIKALLILLTIAIICAVAICYFAIQIIMFDGESSITSSCVLNLIFWSLVEIICLILFVFSVIFNIKEYKYIKNKNKAKVISEEPNEKENKESEQKEILSEEKN